MSTTSDVVERFMRYVQVDSQSDPHNDQQTPSTPRQISMARMLAQELCDLGCGNVIVDEHAYVTASFAASEGCESLPALGLCAHIDSSSDAPGSGVKPHIVHYEGGDLVAGIVNGVTIATTQEDCPDLRRMDGQDIICSDGSTLLSADDKAGVAEICSLLKRLGDDPSLAHPTLKIAFVPDEEIGHGASLLDLDYFGAKWCYTVDGEALGEISYECFNAAEVVVNVRGVTIHPGNAKNIMVNAIGVAMEFDRMLPAFERPEHTEGYEGYYHALEMTGTSSEAMVRYIIRDFDADGFADRQKVMQEAVNYLNHRYGEGTVSITIKPEYRNMAEHLRDCMFLVDHALDANLEVGIKPHIMAIRGGTDGAQLTFRGLPCPNIATGGYNAHSIREFVPVQSLERTVDMLVGLVAKFAVEQPY